MAAAQASAHAYLIPRSVRMFGLFIRFLGWVLPGPASKLAYRMWFKAGRRPLLPEDEPFLSRASQEVVTVDGRKIAVMIWGAGPTVLLAHGWGSRGVRMGPLAIALAREGYTAIAFDAPGHGASEGQGTSAIMVAAVMRSLAEKYGPLAGAITHSFGGIAVNYAIRQGLQVPRLVCISPPADFERLFTMYIATLGLSQPIADRMRALAETEFGPELFDQLTMYHQPQEIKIPALIIHDREDQVAPFEGGEKLAHDWPNAEFLPTQGLGHSRILKDPEIITAATRFILNGK